MLESEILDGDNKCARFPRHGGSLLTRVGRYRCGNCDELRDARRYTELVSFPPVRARPLFTSPSRRREEQVLHFSLLRFTFDLETLERKKSTHSVEFPFTIDMNQFICDDAVRQPALYDLKGVLLHKGGSAHHGHYMAEVFDVKSVDRLSLQRHPLMCLAGDRDGTISTTSLSVRSPSSTAPKSSRSTATRPRPASSNPKSRRPRPSRRRRRPRSRRRAGPRRATPTCSSTPIGITHRPCSRPARRSSRRFWPCPRSTARTPSTSRQRRRGRSCPSIRSRTSGRALTSAAGASRAKTSSRKQRRPSCRRGAACPRSQSRRVGFALASKL